jgi:hypothetical protein
LRAASFTADVQTIKGSRLKSATACRAGIQQAWKGVSSMYASSQSEEEQIQFQIG